MDLEQPEAGPSAPLQPLMAIDGSAPFEVESRPNVFTDKQLDDYKEQDRYLPIANVGKIMKTALPVSAKISKDAKECVQECVSEFISFLSSEAADKVLTDKRKTINGEDILYSMTTLGFDNYAEACKIYLAKYRMYTKDNPPRPPPHSLSHTPDIFPTSSHPNPNAHASSSRLNTGTNAHPSPEEGEEDESDLTDSEEEGEEGAGSKRKRGDEDEDGEEGRGGKGKGSRGGRGGGGGTRGRGRGRGKAA